MRFHVSYAFHASQDRIGGWTENFWNEADDIATAVAAALTLRPLLKKLHGAQSINLRCRVSADEGPRLYKMLRFKDTPGAVAGTNDSDQAMQALLLELTGNPEGQTRQWIKGIPDNQVARGGVMDLKDPYPADFTTFRTELKRPGSGWCVRLVVDENEFVTIDGISETGVLTVPGHGLLGIQRMFIKGVKMPLGINGVRKVKVKSEDLLQLLGYEAQVGVPYKGQGFIRLHAFETFPIGDAELVYATSKRIGRPSAVVTGRRSKRRR